MKRIVNLAVECGPDDHGLGLAPTSAMGGKGRGASPSGGEGGGAFEKYDKIGMRDTVEEENVGRGVRSVCALLGMSHNHPRKNKVLTIR